MYIYSFCFVPSDGTGVTLYITLFLIISDDYSLSWTVWWLKFIYIFVYQILMHFRIIQTISREGAATFVRFIYLSNV